MTKRLTITLVALALFVLIAVLPVSAANMNQTNVTPGSPVVFIGETGINISPCVAGPRQIAWFPSTAVSGAKVPEKVIDVGANMNTFQINPTDFGTRTGNWYCWTAGNMIDNSPLAFIVADPSITVAIWDLDQNKDISGKSVPAGERVTFRIDTNMYSLMTSSSRNQASGQGSPVWGDFTNGPANVWASNGFYIFNTTPETLAVVYSGLGMAAGVQRNGTAYGFNQSGTYVGNRSNYGFIDIRVKTPDNAILTELANASINTPRQISIPLTGMIVDMQPWYWGNRTFSNNMFWNTSALDIMGHRLYPSGTYNIYAEVNINGMKDNYKNNGVDYTGKTVSATQQITLVANTVAITADKDSVTRSKPFSVTITGRPATIYYLWVKGTTSMTGTWDDQPPMLMQQQVGLLNDTAPYEANGGVPAAGTAFTDWGTSYFPQNSGTNPAYLSIQTARFPYNGTRYLGAILTNDAGTRTIQWMTTNMTKAQTYTFRVENWTAADGFLSDERDVKVEKGAVTITASGDQSYYLGEEIKFSGTNTETETTWLFITGPNLNLNGAQIQNVNPRAALAAIVPGTVAGAVGAPQNVPTNTDNTWSWKWGTATYALDAGTYTIYATSASRNAATLNDVVYGTVSIVIKKPFVSATVSQSTVAQGDSLFIRGTAEGKPAPGVQIWILGKNYANVQQTSVNADASFEFELKSAATQNLYAGQYFVVVQHPMQNNAFDIRTNVNQVFNAQLGAAGQNIFTLLGQGSLQGSDAAEALAQAINDPNVDDTYTKLQFLIEVPTIRIDSIGDRHVGDKFTITATTNLAVDDNVLFEVYSSSFKPTQKSQSGEFSGSTGTVKVVKGDTGLNKLAFDVDASTFKPDEYLVTANRVGQQPAATATALFNVLEGAAPTAVPTKVVTAAPTAAPTTVATPVPTATPTKTPTQPGFGALVALIGLGAVAFFVVRRH